MADSGYEPRSFCPKACIATTPHRRQTDDPGHKTQLTHGYCFCSVAQSRLTLFCDSMDCSTPGFPVLTIFRSLLRLMFIESVMLSNHLILCCALLLCLQSFPASWSLCYLFPITIICICTHVYTHPHRNMSSVVARTSWAMLLAHSRCLL